MCLLSYRFIGVLRLNQLPVSPIQATKPICPRSRNLRGNACPLGRFRRPGIRTYSRLRGRGKLCCATLSSYTVLWAGDRPRPVVTFQRIWNKGYSRGSRRRYPGRIASRNLPTSRRQSNTGAYRQLRRCCPFSCP